jgi:hypothetical protein
MEKALKEYLGKRRKRIRDAGGFLGGSWDPERL